VHIDRAHSIYFKTLGEGRFVQLKDRTVGGIIYEVVAGGGIFKGVSGLVTLNGVAFRDRPYWEAGVFGELEAPIVPEGKRLEELF